MKNIIKIMLMLIVINHSIKEDKYVAVILYLIKWTNPKKHWMKIIAIAIIITITIIMGVKIILTYFHLFQMGIVSIVEILNIKKEI